MYTADIRHQYNNTEITKFADDTALIGLITENDEAAYKHEIQNFVSWCDDNFLQLNVKKTKEMVIDFRQKKPNTDSVEIKGEKVEKVKTYKYLGVVFDDKLSWREHADTTARKIHSRMYCLRKLRSFNVSQKILQMFYTAVIGSVLTFGMSCWGGNLSKQDKGRLDKLIRKAGGVIGRKQDDLGTLHDRVVIRKYHKIMSDNTHPLREEFESRKTERSNRFRLPATRTTRYKQSFIPTAIRMHNSNTQR